MRVIEFVSYETKNNSPSVVIPKLYKSALLVHLLCNNRLNIFLLIERKNIPIDNYCKLFHLEFDNWCIPMYETET